MLKKSFFLTLEGADGVGKTTQAQLLADWLRQEGYKPLLTREPGGGFIAEKIRGLLLDPTLEMANLTELFLYEASRIEHLEKIIRPALQAHRFVICDRFTDATLAYQGYARGLPLKTIHQLNHIATQGLKPDLTLLLDLPAKAGFQSALRRNGAAGADRLEKEGLAFQTKVRRGYLAIAKKESRRIKRIPVQNTIEKTQQLIRDTLIKKLHGHHWAK